MQPASPRIIELFNDALTFELTVTNTYFLHARMLDNWGLPKLGKVFYELSIDEMKDADDIINRILMFDGHPNVQKLNAITVGESAEEMLRLALESEKAAVAQFNARPRSATTSATTPRPRSSRTWPATRRSTPTGSRASSTRSTGSASRTTLPQQIEAGEAP